jgi:hypothetical protein
MTNPYSAWMSDETHIFLLSAATGVARGLVGFPIEQPLEAIKTQWQASPGTKNEFKITKQIIESKGLFKGFYNGSIPNFTRIALKNLYRYPLMITTPDLIERFVPLAKNDRRVSKGLTGFTISGIEALILCPVERIKTFMMTRQIDHNQTVWQRLTKDSNLVRELYRGYFPLLTRQTVAWVTFLIADQQMKDVLRHHLLLNRSEAIPARHLMVGSMFVALINTVVIMPFDCIKTHMQKAGNFSMT